MDYKVNSQTAYNTEEDYELDHSGSNAIGWKQIVWVIKHLFHPAVDYSVDSKAQVLTFCVLC